MSKARSYKNVFSLKNCKVSEGLNILNKLTDKNILNFVLGLIVFKPIFDLDWRWPLFYAGSIPIPFHRIIAFIVPAIITVILLLRLLMNTSVRLNNNIFAVIFLVSVTITLFLHIDLYSLDEYLRIYSFFIIFLVTPILIGSHQEFYRIAKFMISISLVPTFLSYLQTFGFLPFTYYDYLPIIGQIGRASGGYYHPTGYLNYLLILIPLIIYLYMNKIVSKKFFWVWFLFTLPMVGRSLHRATILLVLFQLAVYIFFYKRGLFKYFITICFFILLAVYSQRIWQFINIGGAITEAQFRGRNYIWTLYMNHFQNSDFSQHIFGLGSPMLPNERYEPHSDWLRVLFNYGYSGFILYVSFLLSAAFVFFTKFLQIKRESRINSEALLGLILVLTIILYSITMEPLRYSSFGWICAFVLGYLYKAIINPIKVKI